MIQQHLFVWEALTATGAFTQSSRRVAWCTCALGHKELRWNYRVEALQPESKMQLYDILWWNGVWTSHTSSKQGRPLPRLNSPHSWPAKRCVHFHKSLWNTACSGCNNVYIKERIQEEQSGLVKVNSDFETCLNNSSKIKNYTSVNYAMIRKTNRKPCLPFQNITTLRTRDAAPLRLFVGFRKASCSFALCCSDIQMFAALNKRRHVNVCLRGWERNRKGNETCKPFLKCRYSYYTQK